VDIRDKIEERDFLKRGTHFVWVKGHANDEGNIAADRLAVEGATMGRGITGVVEAAEQIEKVEAAEEEIRIRDVSGEDYEEAEVEEAYKIMQQAMDEAIYADEDGDGEDFAY